MRDDGVVRICNLVDQAESGEMPRMVLQQVSKHWFESRTIGVSRIYAARGVNEQIDLLIRIEENRNVTAGQYAVLGNGDQYRISFVTSGQEVVQRSKLTDQKYYRSPEIVGLPYTELTLTKVQDYFDVEDNNNG